MDDADHEMESYFADFGEHYEPDDEEIQYYYSEYGPPATMYALGANIRGTCVEAVELENNHYGCSFTPSVASDEIAKAVTLLAKKKLHFGGFAKVGIINTGSYWSGDEGTDVHHHSNIIFVNYGSYATTAFRSHPDNEVPIKIVN